MIYGILGMGLILFAWIVDAIITIKTKKGINIYFGLLYVIGAILLTVHSLIIHDAVFIALNLSSFVISSVVVLYSIDLNLMRKSKKVKEDNKNKISQGKN